MRILSIILIWLLGTVAFPAGNIIGRTSIIDGDTLEIHGTRIRLFGVDAPESSQYCKATSGALWRCGQRAALSLADYIGDGTVTCHPKDTDRHGRTMAVCYKGNQDLNAWLVLNGWAMVYQKDSKDYVDAEGLARKTRQNIWAGEVTPPWEWRSGIRGKADENEGRSIGTNPSSSAASTQKPADDCSIKGDIRSTGERVYHVPGSTWYGKTAINTTQGERWFCTEEEARDAGWRKARRVDQPSSPSVRIERQELSDPAPPRTGR